MGHGGAVVAVVNGLFHNDMSDTPVEFKALLLGVRYAAAALVVSIDKLMTAEIVPPTPEENEAGECLHPVARRVARATLGKPHAFICTRCDNLINTE